MNSADTLVARLKSGAVVVAPGAYDCITARLVAQAGFDVGYKTDGGDTRFPDHGLVSISEQLL